MSERVELQRSCTFGAREKQRNDKQSDKHGLLVREELKVLAACSATDSGLLPDRKLAVRNPLHRTMKMIDV